MPHETKIDAKDEWELIAELLSPGVKRAILGQIPSSVVDPAPVVNSAPVRMRPQPCGKGRRVREEWIIAYLGYSGKAPRKELVEASGIPNSTLGRLLASLLEREVLTAEGSTNDRIYWLI